MADFLALCMGFLIVGACVHEVRRSKWDAFQPIYFALLGFFGVYCLQYVIGKDQLFSWFEADQIAYALLLACIGLLFFVFGYYSPLSKKIAVWMPKPMHEWRSGALTPFALFLVALGVVGQVWFIARSGGAEVFFSKARGAGAYATNTAYLYGAKWLITPGIIFWAVDSSRRRGLSRYLWLAVAVPWFLYQLAMGQRSGVFSVGVLTMACLLVPQEKTKEPLLAISAFACVMLAVGFVANFRGEFHLGSGYEGVKSFWEKPVGAQVHTLTMGTITGGRRTLGRGSELAMHINYVRIFPEYVDFDYGLEYSQLLVAWIPRLLWPSRPDWREPKRQAISSVIGTSHLDGPAATMFGMYYTHFGVLSLFVGAFLTGALLGAIARMRELWPRSMGVMLVFLSFFNMYKLAMGNGAIHSFRFWGIWVLLPVVLAHYYLKISARGGSTITPQREVPLRQDSFRIP